MADSKPLAARKTGQKRSRAKSSTPRSKTTKRAAKPRAAVPKNSTRRSSPKDLAKPGAKPTKRAAKPRAKRTKRAARATKDPVRRSNANDLAKQQRDISVSEFFAKNRHLLNSGQVRLCGNFRSVAPSTFG